MATRITGPWTGRLRLPPFLTETLFRTIAILPPRSAETLHFVNRSVVLYAPGVQQCFGSTEIYCKISLFGFRREIAPQKGTFAFEIKRCRPNVNCEMRKSTPQRIKEIVRPLPLRAAIYCSSDPQVIAVAATARPVASHQHTSRAMHTEKDEETQGETSTLQPRLLSTRASAPHPNAPKKSQK